MQVEGRDPQRRAVVQLAFQPPPAFQVHHPILMTPVRAGQGWQPYLVRGARLVDDRGPAETDGVRYDLGVDLGTTFVAAAIARDGRTEMCTLGNQTVVS